jgi:LysM repeat protein
MAILNGLYIHVIEESLVADVETTSHPVESGVPTTDTVRVMPLYISIRGKIVDYGSTTATKVLAKINELKNSGSLIEYRGRNVASSMQIQAFEAKYDNANNGGADFTMDLKQVRIAKSAYVPKEESTEEREEEQRQNPTIEVGSVVVFKGGNVYVSSDANKAAATRGRSTCDVTHINTASYATHPYHLISKDGKKVYGWVNKADIEGTETTGTNGKTNAGTQQVKKNSAKKNVYHTVKRGDTVWSLVNKKYKSLKTTCSWVMKNNPKAFSKKGDASTLKIGAKLLMGKK